MKIIDNSTFFPWDLICEVDDLLLHRVQAKHLHGSGEILKMSLDIRKLLSFGIFRKILMEISRSEQRQFLPKSLLPLNQFCGIGNGVDICLWLADRNPKITIESFISPKTFCIYLQIGCKDILAIFTPYDCKGNHHTDSALNGISWLHRLENVL